MSTQPVARPEAPVLRRADRDGVATLWLNRPTRQNALSEELIAALQGACDELAAEPAVRVVVLAGSGPAFCAGHDLREMRAHPDPDYYRELFARCTRMMLSLAGLPQPVIARVHGVATAAGCQLVATCDLAVASDAARFATSGIDVGLFCATPGVPLSRNVSRKRAFEMLLTGEFIDARTALDWGLVNRVVPLADLDAAVAKVVKALVDGPRHALASTKRLVRGSFDRTLSEQLAAEGASFGRLAATDDFLEGVAAFLDKRPAKFE
jgi:enoyl-CoA hydratase/carnithine racemase